MRCPTLLKATLALGLALVSSFGVQNAHAANDWAPMATISATTTMVTNSLCFTDGLDIICNGTGPAAGGGSTDRITSSTTAAVIANQTGGTVSFTLGSTPGAAYFHPSMGLVTSGVSTTGNISASTLLSSGRATFKGGLLFDQGSSGMENLIYTGGTSAGAVNASLGFFVAGVGSNTANQGPYFLGRGNNFNGIGSQRGSMLFVAGNPSSPNTYEGALQFWTGNEVRRMIIEATGNVGIATTAAAATTLDVSGSIKLSADGAQVCDTNRKGAIKFASNEFSFCRNGTAWETLSSLSGGGGSADRAISGTTQVIAYNNTSATIVTAGVERVIVGTTGNVGIGQQPTANVALSTSGTSYFNGKVGIGLSNPTVALEVSGTISATTLNIGGINVTPLSVSPFSCPVGFTLMQKAGQTIGCMQTAENGSATWTAANNACSNSYGGRLPSSAEWYNAMYNFTLTAETGNWEWTDDAVGETSPYKNHAIIGNTAIDEMSWNYDTTPATYRCFIPASGSGISSSSTLAGMVDVNITSPVSGTVLTYNGASSKWEAVASSGGGGGGGGVTPTFAALADVSTSAAAMNIFGPGSLTGAVNGSNGVTAFGHQALSGASNSGVRNSAFGAYALRANTTGELNTAIGWASLYGLTTGRNNAAMGALAGYGITSGQSNITIGNSTMYYSTTGSYNVAVGEWASPRINGDYNVGIGPNTMYYNVNGGFNVVIGVNAGFGVVNQTGYSGATLLGSYAGRSTTVGNSNTLIGYYAGGLVSTGNNNTMVGQNAGGATSTGSYNLVLGADTNPYASTGSYQLSIGNAIWGNIGSGTGNANRIGINVLSPTVALQVSGTVDATAFTISGVPLTGGGSSDRITSGTTGMYAYNNTSATIVTAGVERVIVGTTGNVGIGQQPGAQMLSVSGSVLGGTYLASSRGTLNAPAFSFSADSNVGMYSPSSNRLGFSVAAVKILEMTNSGLAVGTNISTPSSTLHVSGTIRASQYCDFNGANCTTSPGSGGGGSSDSITSGTTGVYTYNNTSASIATAGVERVVIGTNGNIGIGQQPQAAYALSVSGTTLLNGKLGFNTPASATQVGSLTMGTDTTYNWIQSYNLMPLVINPIGNNKIGINITNPLSLLDVNGGIGTRYNDVTLWVGRMYAPTAEGGDNSWANGTSKLISNGWNGTSDFVNYYVPGSTRSNAMLTMFSGGTVGINLASGTTPSTTVQISGTLRISSDGTACDANRTGAIRYSGGDFSYCRNGTAWESLTSLTGGGGSASDRIVSGTTGVYTYNNTSASIATAGVERLIVGTTGNVGIGQQPTVRALSVSGTLEANGRIGIYTNTSNTQVGLLSMGADVDHVWLQSYGSRPMALNPLGNNVGIGTSAPGAPLTVATGTSQFTDAISVLPSTHATSRRAAINLGDWKWLQDSNGIGTRDFTLYQYTGGIGYTRMAVTTSGSIGIGTGQPAELLHVGNAATGGRFFVGEDGTSRRGLLIAAATGAEMSATIPYARLSAFNYGNMLEIPLALNPFNQAGVGIGTNAPSTTLHTIGSIRIAAETSTTLQTCDANRTGAIRYTGGDFSYCRNGTAWESLTSLTGGGGSASDRIVSGTTGVYTYNNTSASIATAGVERMVIGTTGNVGIGSQPTTASLFVSGTINSTNNYVARATTAVPLAVTVSNSTGLMSIGVASGAGHFSSLAQSGDAILRNSSTSGSNSLIIANETTGDIVLSTGVTDTEKMRITNAGNIGIGTTTPAYPLTISATGNSQIQAMGTTGGYLALSRNFNGTASTADAILGNLSFGGENTSPALSSTAASIAGYVDAAGGFRVKGRLIFSTSDGAGPLPTERMRINSAGLVGIGIATPTTALEVSGTVSATRFVGDGSLLTGIAAGGTPDRIISGTTGMYAYNNTSASIATAGVERFVIGTTGNIGIGQQPTAGYAVYISHTLAAVGSRSGTSTGYVGTSTGGYNIGSSSNHPLVLFTSGTEAIRILPNGYVGIGTTTPATPLDVSGSIKVAGDITYTGNIYGTSDRRLKTDITPLGSSLEVLNRLRPVSYQFSNKLGHTEYGFIAQEVQKLYPTLIGKAGGTSGTLTLNYMGLIAPMVRSIQEVDTRVNKLETENAALRTELDTLRAEVRALAKQRTR